MDYFLAPIKKRFASSFREKIKKEKEKIMTFVKELIPLNGPDREWLESFKLTYNNKPIEYSIYNFKGQLIAQRVWAIDHEKKMILISLGGQGNYYSEGLPKKLVLISKEKIISKIYGRFDLEGNSETGIKVFWKLEKISILEQYKNNEKEIITNIINAFNALGDTTTKRDAVTEVEFHQIASPTYVKDIEL
ncbi:hypothetical protein [Holdemania massiliensis]|uniref:hypothetical protein n=1 Tax=Holdemania massiliensis TaxID=1468449 RepID=UPI001F06FBB4|nr:hypothetical protein [Holdemania massiliensis]MCH1941983.1 hypothetical protein [Holdemania massiliensis]